MKYPCQAIPSYTNAIYIYVTRHITELYVIRCTKVHDYTTPVNYIWPAPQLHHTYALSVNMLCQLSDEKYLIPYFLHKIY